VNGRARRLAERGVTGCKPPTKAIRRRSPGSWLAESHGLWPIASGHRPVRNRPLSRSSGQTLCCVRWARRLPCAARRFWRCALTGGSQCLPNRVVPRKMTPFVLVDERGFCVRRKGAQRENVGCEELRMNLTMACSAAHPTPGEGGGGDGRC
jgi:hypothetical protein